jgi:Uncharacterized protein conserved in bacteria (DUF2188)
MDKVVRQQPGLLFPARPRFPRLDASALSENPPPRNALVRRRSCKTPRWHPNADPLSALRQFHEVLTGSGVASVAPNRQQRGTMPTRKIYHVVPHPSGWAVKIGKARRASAVLKTKEAAIKAASNLAKSAPQSQIVIRESKEKARARQGFEDQKVQAAQSASPATRPYPAPQGRTARPRPPETRPGRAQRRRSQGRPQTIE